jgi:hypothetical protein
MVNHCRTYIGAIYLALKVLKKYTSISFTTRFTRKKIPSKEEVLTLEKEKSSHSN